MKYMFFAQGYGDGVYGACGYGSAQTGTTCPAVEKHSIGPKSELANTGIELWAVATVACLLIFTALVVRIWRRKSLGEKKSGKTGPGSNNKRDAPTPKR
ncbi:MAG TPA: hypothetical protein VF733_03110 [Candidatus Saccharimonadales bacterium]